MRYAKVTLYESQQTSIYWNKYVRFEFRFDYIKSKDCSKSRSLFTDTVSLIDESTFEEAYEDPIQNKEMFDFSNYLIKSKDCHDSKKLVVGKIKDKMDDVAIEKCVGLKPKMYSFWVNDRSDHIKRIVANKNIVKEISHNE